MTRNPTHRITPHPALVFRDIAILCWLIRQPSVNRRSKQISIRKLMNYNVSNVRPRLSWKRKMTPKPVLAVCATKGGFQMTQDQ